VRPVVLRCRRGALLPRPHQMRNLLANPASTVDGGIPLQSSIGRSRPAATDSHRSVYERNP
jgi:hypothetical protein